jgi:hypothetical protein
MAMSAHASQRRAAGQQPRVLDRMLRLPRPLFGLVFGVEWYVEQGGRGRRRPAADIFDSLR